nr:hypothetical protein [Pseudomonadota bacterium]
LNDLPVTEITGGPTLHLPVNVPIATLADWEQIRERLDHVPHITRAEVITLARGMTSIEIEFRGDIEQLQGSLNQQNLSLTQNRTSGAWTLQSLTPASPY